MDRDYLTDSPSETPQDMLDWLVSLHDGVQYRLMASMFVIFLFLSSDIFVGRILANFDGAVHMKTPTNWGTILQGIFLVIACIIADALIKGKII